MDRFQLLHTLLEREERRRDEAMLALRDAQRAADGAQEQASALLTYRGEYRKRWAVQFSQPAAIEIVRCYQGFITRLDQAIDLQQAQAEQCRERVDRALQLLRKRETKVATVRRLIERRQAAQVLQAQRREQKSNDEIGQRLSARATPVLAA